MSRIAIIDTVVDPEGLHCNTFEGYNVCKNEYSNRYQADKSHGTICAMVLDQCTSDYDLVNVQALTSHNTTQAKSTGYIENLCKALQLCSTLNIDIISLSIVSSVLSDSKYLFDIVKDLTLKSIIVAALDNKRYITVPTCYPFVIGVQSDRANYLMPGELAYLKDDPLLANIYANCNFNFIKKLYCSPSNSLAVPVAAAFINNLLNQGKNIQQTLKELKPYNITREQENSFIHPVTYMAYDPPIIIVYGANLKHTYHTCQFVMDLLFSNYNVQSTGLCSIKVEYDIRFKTISSINNINDDLKFMECHYKTDLIFVVIRECERNKIASAIISDVEVRIDRANIKAIYEIGCIESNIKNMADILFHILS